MEIKTTEQILNDCEKFLEIPIKREGMSYVFPNPKTFLDTHWVRVEDVKEAIKNFQSKKKQISDKIIIQEELKNLLIDELSQSNNKGDEKYRG